MRTGMDIKQDMMETNNMNPVAFMASSGKVITADDAEMMLKHSASYLHIQLYSADQLRQAKVEVLMKAVALVDSRAEKTIRRLIAERLS